MATATTDLRVMSIMAHPDDFEFTAGGTFALLRQTYGDRVKLKVITTQTGDSGHQHAALDDNFRRRQAEATKAAALIGAEYECLKQLDGFHVSGNVLVDRNLLGGLWNAIRAFEPDVVFCPPVANDPLAGVHVDHEQTAIAVRYVAYMVAVPHAFPTVGGPVKLWVPTPLIVNADDGYVQTQNYALRQDISEVYPTKQAMLECHESQMNEWLPFVGSGRDEPATGAQVRARLRERHLHVNRRHGAADDRPSEFFAVTRWGRAPREGELERLFPRLVNK